MCLADRVGAQAGRLRRRACVLAVERRARLLAVERRACEREREREG